MSKFRWLLKAWPILGLLAAVGGGLTVVMANTVVSNGETVCAAESIITTTKKDAGRESTVYGSCKGSAMTFYQLAIVKGDEIPAIGSEYICPARFVVQFGGEPVATEISRDCRSKS